MLRILHTADWHLGQSLHGFERDAEHAAALEAILAVAEDENVDAVLVSGDVYHAANPPLTAQKAFFGFMRQLADRLPDTDFIAIAGNHDSGARLELPSALGLGDRIRLIGAPPRRDGRLDPAAAVVPLTDKDGAPRAALIAFPYPRPGDLTDWDAPAEPVDAAGDRERPVRRYLRRAADSAAERWPGLPLLIAAHLHVAGGAPSQDSERPILIGGEEAIPLSDFPAETAYLALGHLHRPQTVKGAPLAVYSGAPIPLAMDEAAYPQSVTLIAVDGGEDGAPRLSKERRRLPRSRAFIRVPKTGAASPDALEMALDALAERIRAEAAEQGDGFAPPFLEVAALLSGPEPDLRRRVEAALGDAPVRLARIRRETAGAEEGPDGETSAAAAPPAPPTPLEAFEALHQDRYDAPAADALRDAFLSLARAVQNEDAVAAADRAEAAEAPVRRRARR